MKLKKLVIFITVLLISTFIVNSTSLNIAQNAKAYPDGSNDVGM